LQDILEKVKITTKNRDRKIINIIIQSSNDDIIILLKKYMK